MILIESGFEEDGKNFFYRSCIFFKKLDSNCSNEESKKKKSGKVFYCKILF